MLKRCQVLLLDWQEEYLKLAAETHDLSFSEVVRIFLSEGIFNLILTIHQEYRPGVNKKELVSITKKATNPATPREEQYRLMAKLYFEARKAAEYRMAKLRKRKK